MADNSATILLQSIKANVSEFASLPVKSPISKEIKYIDKLTEQIIEQTPWVVLKVGFGVMLIMLGWVVSGWIATRLTRWLLRAHMEETLANFLASTARFVLFFNIFVVGLTVIGVSSTSLAALLGAIGLAVGFALRNTFGSVAGGLMLMVHRPVKVGDWIELTNPNGSPSGTVKRIGLFSTEINTKDFVRVFIPNAMMWETVLRNDTYNRMRMVKVEFGVGHEVNVRKAFDIVKDVLAANPLALKSPEAVLAVENFAEAGVMCSLEVWTRTEDRRALRNTILLEIMEALGNAGMRMAYHEKAAEKKAANHKVRTAKKEAQALGKQPGKRAKLPPR